MPYELSWEAAGVVFRFSGIVSDDDLVASNDEIYASPRFPEMRYQIVDFSTIDKFDVSAAAVRAVSRLDRRASEINPNVRVAIITSETFVLGMSRMYGGSHEAAGGTWATEVFEREEEARAWAVPSS